MMYRKILDLDHRLSQKISTYSRPGALRVAMVVFAHSGDSWFWLLGLGVVYWLGGPAWQLPALWFAAAILITAGIVLVLKFTIRRGRPAGDWGQIYRRTDPHSFPSGHAARGALLAGLSLWLGPSWLSWILLAWFPLVSLARVSLGIHYLSDVLAGSVLGAVLAIGFYWVNLNFIA